MREFKLQYLQFLGLRARQKLRCALRESRSARRDSRLSFERYCSCNMHLKQTLIHSAVAVKQTLRY